MRSWNWRELALPDEEEKDPHFKVQIDRLSVIGLRIIAAVCVSGVVYFTAAGLLMPPAVRNQLGGIALPITIFSLGVFSFAASYWARARSYARWIGMVVGYGVAVAQFFNMGAIVERPETGYFLLQGIVTGVMLIGIAALPMKPMHVVVLGGSIVATFTIATPWVLPVVDSNHSGAQLAFVSQVVLLCTALTIVVYRQRVLAYRARRSAHEALRELQDAQARLLVSENAHSQSRLAAALSHELNTPLGAVTSALDTLIHVFKKEGLDGDERYREVLNGAEMAGRGSAARLHEIVQRMKYLSNLDRAEQQRVDLNELCRETIASLGQVGASVDMDFDCDDSPTVECRPQQLSAVLSNLLRNAATAIEPRGRVTLATRKRESGVLIEVRDDGRGISNEQLETLFEPSFQMDGARVTTTNWGLFVCRAIVSEHGGNLDVESKLGEGTTARIELPMRQTPKDRRESG